MIENEDAEADMESDSQYGLCIRYCVLELLWKDDGGWISWYYLSFQPC